LLWERKKSETLEEKLKEANQEIGMLKSELDEIKHSIKTGEDLPSKYAALLHKHKKVTEAQKDRDDKIRDLKKEVEELIIKLAKKNLESNENK
jgi:chromosome segregation ATPase